MKAYCACLTVYTSIYRKAVRGKQKISCGLVNQTEPNFGVFTKFFFNIFEQALLKSR